MAYGSHESAGMISFVARHLKGCAETASFSVGLRNITSGLRDIPQDDAQWQENRGTKMRTAALFHFCNTAWF